MKISVCVPTSRSDTVAATIHSILRQSWPDWEIIAVGQGDLRSERAQATKATLEAFSSRDERVRYVHIAQRGATRARNAAVAAAEGEVLAFIDDDCEADDYWLETIADYFDQAPTVGLIGGAVVAPQKVGRGFAVCPAVSPAETVYDPVASERTPPSGWEWISGNVAMRREVAQSIGPWDEHMGPGTAFPVADDTDYLLRAEALGIKMATTPRAIVHHTYGCRYNRQVLRHLRGYTYGNGGLAAKLTLMGDPRGREWLEGTRQERLLGWLRPFRPQRFLRSFIGWTIFARAYSRCLREYAVEDGVLVPRSQAKSRLVSTLPLTASGLTSPAEKEAT
jgi:GT2 family glycosyltransferase